MRCVGPPRAEDFGLRAEVDVIAPSKAWGRRKGCNDYTSETFRRNPAGKARPVAPDQRLEASLASGEATRTAKRRQRARKPCY